ncbi:MAG TPA: class I SAM-dependent methyltransferase [Spirochaetota bacterium]|nr:class I SAM-dependent methyltransferase [Spirochaetota bacterium]HOM10474.1 class I SAM-dependent methyltransferase [Spirochaetota bacterium]
MKSWFYDESKHSGVNYASIELIQQYDENHSKFRNFAKEADEIISDLKLTTQSIVADIGCGTCAITQYIAKKVKKIYAIDISSPMLDYARQKYHTIHNIEYIHSGFLGLHTHTFIVDAVYTKMALHHLPDFWKQMALKNISSITKPGGRLLYEDVIFSGDIETIEQNIDQWINQFKQQTGDEFAREVEMHVKEEFSTFDWAIEHMLHNAGYKIDARLNKNEMIIKYICTKQ